MASQDCTMRAAVILLVVLNLHGATAQTPLEYKMPKITIDPATPYVGDKITLTCAFDAKDQETNVLYTWKLDPVPAGWGSTVEMDTGVYVIENIQPQNTKYTCKGSKNYGSSSGMVFSYVSDPFTITPLTPTTPAPTTPAPTTPAPTTPAPTTPAPTTPAPTTPAPTTPAPTTPAPTTPAPTTTPTTPPQKPTPTKTTKSGPMNPAEVELNCANDVVACTNTFYMTRQEIMDWYAFRTCIVNIMPGCTKQDAMLWNVADQIRRAEQGTQVSDDAPRATPAVGVLLVVVAIVAAWKL